MVTVTPITVTPLSEVNGAPFGAEVRGVDLTRDLSDELMRDLTAALYEHRVIVIRDQELDKPSYYRFGEQWGAPIPHVLEHMRMADFPAMMTIGNTEERDKADKIRNGAALWHTDQSYEATPASATMLYSIIAPRIGGETRFANMVAAYDGLDEETRARCDTLTVGHLYGQTRLREDELAVNPLVGDNQVAAVPTCWHPLVRRHPVTGRKGLYAVGHGAFKIEGMEDKEASDFLYRLKEHCVRPEYVYKHKYAVGDLCIFDTLSTMHCATPIDVPTSTDDDIARLLWRISVRGLPAVHSHLAA